MHHCETKNNPNNPAAGISGGVCVNYLWPVVAGGGGMTKDTALDLALEALDIVKSHFSQNRHVNGAITAIKQARSAPVQEPVSCDACNGSGWVVRDPDIGTDQECFVCDGTGVSDDTTPPAAPVQPVAWGIIASNTGRICQVELDAVEIEGYNPKHIVPLYTTPPAAQPAVPDAIHHTDDSESPEYRTGWNDCRAEMLKGVKP
jgi:hypothetical protein